MATIWLALFSFDAEAAADKSLEVAPTTLELKPGEAGLLYVANHSAAPVTVQIDIYDWSQPNGTDRLTLSDTAFVSPPFTTIAPGERQIVRVLAQPATRDRETAYRIRVSELPDARAKSDGVQILLQFSVPAFVSAGKSNSAIAWTAITRDGALELDAQNTGVRTAKLAGLHISSPGAKDIGFGNVSYILPGATRTWEIAAPQSAGPLRIDGTDERSGKPISADIAR